MGGPVRLDRYALGRLSPGRVQVSRVSVGVTDAVDVAAGTNPFAHARLVIDYPRRRTRLLPPRPCA